MPSRRKRKRYRRQQAEATAEALKPRGSGARNAWTAANMDRGDWRLVQRAANQDWRVNPFTAEAVCRALSDVVKDEAARVRLFLAMADAALAMDRANLRAE